MKKNILILAWAAMVAIACKKNETPDVLVEDIATSDQEQNVVPQTPDNTPLTSLALSENFWDFKEVKKGQTVEHVYEITNTGNQPLVISEVKPACGCTAPDYTKEPILPGQKGQVTLRFDSSDFQGLQTKQAQVYANVEKSPILLTFTANVIN